MSKHFEVSRRGFTGQSLCRADNMSGVTVSRKQRATGRPQGGHGGSRGFLTVAVHQERRSMVWAALSKHKLGLDHSRLGRLEESVWDSKDSKHLMSRGKSLMMCPSCITSWCTGMLETYCRSTERHVCVSLTDFNHQSLFRIKSHGYDTRNTGTLSVALKSKCGHPSLQMKQQ